MDNFILYRNTEWKEEHFFSKKYLIPYSFQFKKIKDISTIVKGTQLNKKDFVFGEFPFYNGGKLPSGYINNFNKENKISISEGGASAGSVNLIKDKFWSGGHNYTLDSLNVNQSYLYFLLQLNQSKLYKLQQGSALPNIPAKELNKFNLLINNSVEEQEKIAKILTTQEDLISSKKELVEKYKKQRKYFQQELLSGRLRIRLNNNSIQECIKLGLIESKVINKIETYEIVESKKEDFEIWLNDSFANKIEFYKNSNNNWKSEKINGRMIDIPFDWEVKKVKDIFEISRGKVISKDYIQQNKGNYPVYSSATENNGCIGYIDSFSHEGEYLTWTTDGIYAGTLFYRNGKFSPTNICGILKQKQNSSNNLKIFELFGQKNFYNNVEKIGNSKLMSNVVEKIKLYLPSTLLEQTFMATQLTKLDELIESLEKEIELEETKFKFFKQELLLGRIRVK